MSSLFWKQEHETRSQVQEKNYKKHKHVEVKQYPTIQQWVTEEIKKEIQNTWRKMKMET